MIFLFGVIFMLVGFVMLFRIFRNSKRARIDGAIVLEITKEFYLQKGVPSGPRKFPHARVEYFHDGHKMQGKVMLKSKPNLGEGIQLTVDPKNPAQVEEYYPKKEAAISIIIIVVGAAIVIGCIFLTDWMDS